MSTTSALSRILSFFYLNAEKNDPKDKMVDSDKIIVCTFSHSSWRCFRFASNVSSETKFNDIFFLPPRDRNLSSKILLFQLEIETFRRKFPSRPKPFVKILNGTKQSQSHALIRAFILSGLNNSQRIKIA